MVYRLPVHFQNTAEGVLQEKGAKVADMRRAVNSGSAAVKPKVLVCLGLKGLQGTAVRIV